jgi:hypothetical protein
VIFLTKSDNSKGSYQNKKNLPVTHPPPFIRDAYEKNHNICIALLHVSGSYSGYVIFKVGTQMRINRQPPTLLGQCPKFDQIFFLTASLNTLFFFKKNLKIMGGGVKFSKSLSELTAANEEACLWSHQTIRDQVCSEQKTQRVRAWKKETSWGWAMRSGWDFRI